MRHSLLAAALCSILALPAWAAPVELGTLEHRAAAGDPEAAYELAGRLEHAEGVPRDVRRALMLYCRAARKGLPKAAFQLGWMRLNGRGMPRDDARAAYWLTAAADAGHVQARNLLARLGGAVLPDGALCHSPAPASSTIGADPPGQPPRAPAEVAELVRRLAPTYGLDPDLVLAMIAVESAFRPNAISPKNAQGLMQLIPATAARFGVADPFDAEDNVRGGMAYLGWLLAEFDGDVTLALAAYNAGENAVKRHGGIPPYPETIDYVRKVRRLYLAAMHPIRLSAAQGPSRP